MHVAQITLQRETAFGCDAKNAAVLSSMPVQLLLLGQANFDYLPSSAATTVDRVPRFRGHDRARIFTTPWNLATCPRRVAVVVRARSLIRRCGVMDDRRWSQFDCWSNTQTYASTLESYSVDCISPVMTAGKPATYKRQRITQRISSWLTPQATICPENLFPGQAATIEFGGPVPRSVDWRPAV